MDKETKPIKKSRAKKVKPVRGIPDTSRIWPFVPIVTDEVSMLRYKHAFSNDKGWFIGIDPGYDTPTISAIRKIDDTTFEAVVQKIRIPEFKGTVGQLAIIHEAVENFMLKYVPIMALLEDYAYAKTNKAHQMGEIGFLLRYLLSKYLNSYARYMFTLCGATIEQVLESPPVGTVPIGSWKKALGLPGNAAKIAVQMWLAEYYGIFEKDENVADAMGIAICAFATETGHLPPKGSKFVTTFI